MNFFVLLLLFRNGIIEVLCLVDRGSGSVRTFNCLVQCFFQGRIVRIGLPGSTGNGPPAHRRKNRFAVQRIHSVNECLCFRAESGRFRRGLFQGRFRGGSFGCGDGAGGRVIGQRRYRHHRKAHHTGQKSGQHAAHRFISHGIDTSVWVCHDVALSASARRLSKTALISGGVIQPSSSSSE